VEAVLEVLVAVVCVLVVNVWDVEVAVV